MFKHLGKGISIVTLLFSCWAGMVHADETKVACGKDGEKACDVTFLLEPAFADMCLGATQSRVFTIQNNSPVTMNLASIRVVNALDGSVNPDATIPFPRAPTNPCGATLAAGQTCNIEVDLAPTIAETFNLQLQIDISNSNQPLLIAPITASAVAGCNVSFSVVNFTDVCTTGSETQTYTITNNSSVTLTIGTIQVAQLLPSDGLPANAAVVTPSGITACVTGNTLAPAASCTVDVTIQGSGSDSGTLNRQLQVLFNDGVLIAPPPILANILPTPCGLLFTTPLPVPFNMVCNVHQPLTYILKNTSAGGLPVAVPSITNADGTPAQSTIISNNCPATLGAGLTCQIVVDLFESCSDTPGVNTLDRTLTVGTVLAPPITSTITVSTTPPPPPPAIDYLTPAGRACAVLGGSTVTNIGNTVVTNGDVCVSPGTAITGFPPGLVVGGIAQSNTTVAVNAQFALSSASGAITTLLALPCTTDLTGTDLGTLPSLTAGVYCFTSSAQLTGIVTLTGDANSVFVFQIGTDLTTASASQVILSGVNPANVYWVERSATLGTGTLFQGNILAKASITMNTGSSLVFGRALAVAAVTMSSSPVTNPPIAP